MDKGNPLNCSECGVPMLIGSIGLICPDGHGKIIPRYDEQLETLRKKFPDRVIVAAEPEAINSYLRKSSGLSDFPLHER